MVNRNQKVVEATSFAENGGDMALDWNAEVVTAMEQGVLVWSDDGICLMHNTRIFEVLELSPTDLYVGLSRADFLKNAIARNELTAEAVEATERRFASRLPFSFDRLLPSGRVITTNARPLADHSMVVTFTDVTEARKTQVELEEARETAEQHRRSIEDALKEQEAQRAEMTVLSDLDEWLQACKSLDELFDVLRQFMRDSLPDSEGELYVYSNSRDVLDGACCWGHDVLQDYIHPDACWALRRGRSYAHSPDKISFTCEHVKDQAAKVQPERYVCIPIIAHGDTVGLLHIRFATSNQSSSKIKDPIRFVMRCGERVSMAIANVRLRDELHHQSTRDPLTGLFNRRYLLDALRNAVNAAERCGEEVALISFDADHFKLFNDNHGHDAGDMVLREIGARMFDVLPDGAVPCRFGGEEFIVLLPKTGKTSVLEIAEQLRTTIEAVEIKYSGRPLPNVTISSGIAVFPHAGKLPQDLIKAADLALYQAKSDGRNCVRSS
ncbi:MAG: diguanylate cyclase [Pseudomonadota bacterium]